MKKTRQELLDELPELIKSSGDLQVDKSVGFDLKSLIKDIIDSIMMNSTGLPIGGIISWSGSISNIPPFFVLCNGQSGTPNLRDRFVLGSGNNFIVDQKGGSISHSHTGSIGYHTLTKEEIPPHSHSLSHQIDNWDDGDPDNSSGYKRVTFLDRESGITGGGQGHTHTGGNLATANAMPPYYALAFIMYKGLGWDPSTQLTITITTIDSNKDLYFTITNGTITNGLNVQYSTNGINWSSSAGGVGSPKNVSSWNPINGSYFRLQSLDDANIYSNEFQYIMPNYSNGYSSDYSH